MLMFMIFRLTLNFKRLPYRVEFISIADIEETMINLGAPASSPDRVPKYRLPVIADPSSDSNGKPTYVTESFNIAVYLDDKYPAPKHPTVFPDGTRALQKVASEHITYEIGFALMPIVVPHIAQPGFLDERGHEYFCRTREAWFGDLNELAKSGTEKWGEIVKKWDDIGAKYDLNKGSKEDGPFVMGGQVSFADFAVGGMILWLRRAEGGDMPRWKEIAQRQNGRWARVWTELEKLEQDSTQIA
ncbi:hypothetical protein FRC09_016638 [Ceratobasidium sp. 395]|nr:hypothetical protein FRC09_016638 [Ceratobasidium sp. 395]